MNASCSSNFVDIDRQVRMLEAAFMAGWEQVDSCAKVILNASRASAVRSLRKQSLMPMSVCVNMIYSHLAHCPDADLGTRYRVVRIAHIWSDLIRMFCAHSAGQPLPSLLDDGESAASIRSPLEQTEVHSELGAIVGSFLLYDEFPGLFSLVFEGVENGVFDLNCFPKNAKGWVGDAFIIMWMGSLAAEDPPVLAALRSWTAWDRQPQIAFAGIELCNELAWKGCEQVARDAIVGEPGLLSFSKCVDLEFGPVAARARKMLADLREHPNPGIVALLGDLKVPEAPDDLIDPITLEVYEEPVVAADGHTYERKKIEAWLENHDTSPMTNMPLSNRRLIPNGVISQQVDAFTNRDQQPIPLKKLSFSIVHERAEEGDSQAQCELGLRLRGERLPFYMWTEAVVRVVESAGTMIKEIEGNGVKLSYRKAMRWFSKAADQGSTDACLHLAEHYAYHWGVDLDLNQVRYWCSRAKPDCCSAEISRRIALLYQDILLDSERAGPWLQRAASLGDYVAAYHLGSINEPDRKSLNLRARAQYQMALSILRSLDEWSKPFMVPFLRRAAFMGHSAAQFQIASGYAHGSRGQWAHPPLAKHWYRRAAENGDLYAMIELGKDWENAEHWLTKAASLGSSEAEYQLGYAYDVGWYGIVRDRKKAIQCYERAAAKGHERAKFWLDRYSQMT